jgi:hypothetical protein
MSQALVLRTVLNCVGAWAASLRSQLGRLPYRSAGKTRAIRTGTQQEEARDSEPLMLCRTISPDSR